MRSWWRNQRLARGLRRAMRERRALEARPWEEDLLHWAKDGTLHGTKVPPAPRWRPWPFNRMAPRRLSTTADGWCPAWALEVQRAYLPDVEG